MKIKIKYTVIELKESEEIINRPEIIAGLFKNENPGFQECMWTVGLNSKHRILLKHLVGKGAANQIQIEPREIFIPLLLNLCTKFVVLHNHPTGDTSPSEEDIAFTKRIQKASKLIGIELLDHIILGQNDDFLSFNEKNLL